MNEAKLLLVTLIVFLLLSCQDDCPTSSISTGSIVGYMESYPISNNTAADYSGIKVHFEGTHFKAITDISGRWQIDNVPKGTYNIRYEKEGYSAWLEAGFQFIGTGTAYAQKNYLLKLPTFEITHISTKNMGDTVKIFFQFSDSLLTSNSYHYLYLFVGKTNAVDANKANFEFISSAMIPYYSNNVVIDFRRSAFELHGFTTGDKAYLKIYPTDYGFPRSYFDPTIGHDVYVDRNEKTSKTIEIQVP
ncbi:MAG: carboxypeptidase-like regulatory domain-containing protein [Melioribacteraceae bacterium]|nr:carboxypeptidase-like regulatory domain-containing protein [Melioribacteraceae bacterium]